MYMYLVFGFSIFLNVHAPINAFPPGGGGGGVGGGAAGIPWGLDQQKITSPQEFDRTL